MVKNQFVFLHHIVDSISNINSYIKGHTHKSFKADSKTYDAVIRNLEIIGEASNNISKRFLTKYSQIDWREPIGLRNKLTHEYFDIDSKKVWQVIKKDLPTLQHKLQALLDDYENSSSF